MSEGCTLNGTGDKAVTLATCGTHERPWVFCHQEKVERESAQRITSLESRNAALVEALKQIAIIHESKIFTKKEMRAVAERAIAAEENRKAGTT